eukprot:1732366-Rhodomonas_salina.1
MRTGNAEALEHLIQETRGYLDARNAACFDQVLLVPDVREEKEGRCHQKLVGELVVNELSVSQEHEPHAHSSETTVEVAVDLQVGHRVLVSSDNNAVSGVKRPAVGYQRDIENEAIGWRGRRQEPFGDRPQRDLRTDDCHTALDVRHDRRAAVAQDDVSVVDIAS